MNIVHQGKCAGCGLDSTDFKTIRINLLQCAYCNYTLCTGCLPPVPRDEELGTVICPNCHRESFIKS
jgi:DNA-directed RNA polymerase subunit RPC12/RpoP